MKKTFAALSVTVLSIVSAVNASADVLPGYSAGTGANTSYLVLDFGFIGGDTYLFEYHYDDSASGEDMLLALHDAGDLTVDYTIFDFGTFVNGFSYDGYSSVPGFEGSDGENWSYWGADSTPTTSSDWVPQNVGPTDSVLAGGSYDGWTLNVSSFNSGGFEATNNPPSTVPEPGAVALMLLGGAALLRRRR